MREGLLEEIRDRRKRGENGQDEDDNDRAQPSSSPPEEPEVSVMVNMQNNTAILPPSRKAWIDKQDPAYGNISCSLCSNPLRATKFLIGKDESINWPANAPRSPSPQHLFHFSDETYTWKVRLMHTKILTTTYHTGTTTGEPTFVVCSNCFQIIPRFIGSRAIRGPRLRSEHISSIEILYEYLKRQFLLDPGGQEARLKLDWPEYTYAGVEPTCTFDDIEWRYIIEPGWLQEDTFMPIPSLPNYILSKLQRITPTTNLSVSFLTTKLPLVPRPSQSSSLTSLPSELIYQISKYLPYSSVLCLRSTAHKLAISIPLNQSFYYNAFISRELLGFFFVHDSQDVILEIESKVTERRLGPANWDWIQLMRTLARFENFAAGGTMSDAPGGFRNRRRVWRVLVGMEDQAKLRNDMDRSIE